MRASEDGLGWLLEYKNGRIAWVLDIVAVQRGG